MNMGQSELVFVYNANSGLGNAMVDAAHKVISPSTYSCSLCQLTYGAVREKSGWKRFRQDSPLVMRFLHKDEFEREWVDEQHKGYEFPAIFMRTDEELKLLVPAQELNAMTSEEELIQRMGGILEAYRDA